MRSFKNVAFIPVRGGSKSIPLKNIRLINDRPLVYWVLDAAEKSEYIEHIFVSTDSDIIKDVVQNYRGSKTTVIGRSPETARDTSTTESALLEFAHNYDCTAPHFVNTVRQHFVEYFAGNIQPGLNIPELNEYGGCYRNLYKPLLR